MAHQQLDWHVPFFRGVGENHEEPLATIEIEFIGMAASRSVFEAITSCQCL